jgi:hypothetical protein
MAAARASSESSDVAHKEYEEAISHHSSLSYDSMMCVLVCNGYKCSVAIASRRLRSFCFLMIAGYFVISLYRYTLRADDEADVE